MKQAFRIVLWCLVITLAFGASPMRIRGNAGSNLDTEDAGSLDGIEGQGDFSGAVCM